MGAALCVLRLPPATLELYGNKLVVRPRGTKPLQRRSRPPAGEGQSSSGNGQEPMETEGRAAGNTSIHKESESRAAESKPLHTESESGAAKSTPLHVGGILLPQETAVKLQHVKSVRPKNCMIKNLLYFLVLPICT